MDDVQIKFEDVGTVVVHVVVARGAASAWHSPRALRPSPGGNGTAGAHRPPHSSPAVAWKVAGVEQDCEWHP